MLFCFNAVGIMVSLGTPQAMVEKVLVLAKMVLELLVVALVCELVMMVLRVWRVWRVWKVWKVWKV